MSQPSNVPPIPPHYKILLEHKVEPFACSIFGSAVGHLLDKGLTDMEMLTVMEEFVKMIRAAVKDPRMMPVLMQQTEILKDAADNDE